MDLKDSDALLLEKIQEGDEYAFEIAFLKYYAPMSKYIWKYVRSEDLAEEIVQEVFADLWESRSWLDPGGHLRGLLYEMARNKALDYLKHQKVVEAYIAEAKQKKKKYATIDYQDSRAHQQFIEEVEEAIEKLPPKARRVYRLNREEGLTYKEIARYMDISIKTVESQMRRVLQMLREQLSRYLSIFILIALAFYF